MSQVHVLLEELVWTRLLQDLVQALVWDLGDVFSVFFWGASVVTWTSGLRVTGSRTTAGTVFVSGA